MSNSKKENDGCVPVPIINQLNEHTAGGFVLFYFNANDGTPEQVMTFDSPAHSLALQKHIHDWSIAVQDIMIENEKRIIELNLQSSPDESSEDSD